MKKYLKMAFILSIFITMVLLTSGCGNDDGKDSPSTLTTFTLPGSYQYMDSNLGYTTADIEAGKNIRIYMLTEAQYTDFTKNGLPLTPTLTVTGTTTAGGSSVQYQIPAANIGQTYYIGAFIILDSTLAFDPVGKTINEARALITAPKQVAAIDNPNVLLSTGTIKLSTLIDFFIVPIQPT